MEFKDEVCINHLAGMVKYATVSNGVSANMDFEQFYGLHKYLEETYPLVHKTLKKEIVGKAALLYKWEGTGKSKNLPILLAAHQDVVPEGNYEGWTYPPYEGRIADGYLWGRGASDCKSNMMAHFEAIEALISEGFTPDYDIYLAYGYNEEVGGGDYNSAAAMCDVLKERGVTLGCVIDEGGGVGMDEREGVSVPIGYVRTGEKGYADFIFTIRDKGGHSASPGKESAIAKMGQLAIDIHAAQFPYRVTKGVLDEYKAKGPYMGERGKVFMNMDKDFDAVIPYIEQAPFLAAKFHTTQAITMIKGSDQANILPTEVTMTVNCRLLEGDTVDSLMEKFKKIAGEGVEITVGTGNNPSQVSTIESNAYKCIEELTKELNPGCIVVPAISGGGTDARNYYPICDSVYRYGGFPQGSGSGAHNYNERFKIEGCHKGPEFFYKFIRKYGDFQAC